MAKLVLVAIYFQDRSTVGIWGTVRGCFLVGIFLAAPHWVLGLI